MSQTNRFTRPRQLISTVLPGWRVDGYADQVTRHEQGLFIYLVLERQKANLALARHNLKRIENDLSV
jgi:hypothetical protein